MKPARKQVPMYALGNRYRSIAISGNRCGVADVPKSQNRCGFHVPQLACKYRRLHRQGQIIFTLSVPSPHQPTVRAPAGSPSGGLMHRSNECRVY